MNELSLIHQPNQAGSAFVNSGGGKMVTHQELVIIDNVSKVRQSTDNTQNTGSVGYQVRALGGRVAAVSPL